MIRRILATALFAGLALVPATSPAQSPGRGLFPGESDPLRPYAGPAGRAPARGGWSSGGRPTPAANRRPVAATAQRTYFPGMRTGQGANRNVVDPRSLCVPGRMAMIPRGR